VLIAVDKFSQKEGAVKVGDVVSLESCKTLEEVKHKIYESMSGNKWDNVIDKIDEEYKNENNLCV
jgi:hypothetical protein